MEERQAEAVTLAEQENANWKSRNRFSRLLASLKKD
jgi:hypothetical protein